MKTILKPLFALLLLSNIVACSDNDDAKATQFSITEVTPETGPAGTQVTLTGTNLPDQLSTLTLTFGGVPAEIISASSTQIVTTVPEGAATGALIVTGNGSTVTAISNFLVASNLVSGTISNLFAPQTGGRGEPIGGPFTKFSFATGAVTESDTEWDIAFRGATIAVNGGTSTGSNDEPERNGNAAAAIVNAIFSEIVSAEGLSFDQDADAAFAIPVGSDNGWYNYNPNTNILAPIPGKILVFRTHDDKFAKVEILSYYENAPANPDGFADASRYYTFNYVYNPNEGATNLNN